MHKQFGFLSERAKIATKYISPEICVYGESKIGKNTILDPYILVGYPIRPKIKDIRQTDMIEARLHAIYDKKSTGTIIGENSHIRPFTTLYEMSTLANGVETGTNVIIRENCHIGKNSIIGSGSVLDSGVTIGDRVSIQSNNFIPPKIIIGNDVFLGPNVVFANDRYPISNRLVGTKVEENVRIGIGSIILPGIILKKGAIIAAGSLVTKDVEENSVVRGSPAKVIMTRDEYEEKRIKYEES